MQNSRFLEDAHRRYGVIGVHITPAPWGMAPSHKWFYPLYAKCVELGLCLFVYVGMPGPLWPMMPNDPTVLDEVALPFPDLKIIAHHIGDPWNDVVVRLAARHRNYYICTSAWHPRSYPEQLLSFMKGKWHGTYGSEKVVLPPTGRYSICRKQLRRRVSWSYLWSSCPAFCTRTPGSCFGLKPLLAQGPNKGVSK